MYSVTLVIFNAPSPSLAKLKRSKISCVNGSPGKLRVTFAYRDGVGEHTGRITGGKARLLEQQRIRGIR